MDGAPARSNQEVNMELTHFFQDRWWAPFLWRTRSPDLTPLGQTLAEAARQSHHAARVTKSVGET